MNKTTSINLNGLLFNLEEEAFEKLHNYLNKLKRYFKESDGRDEIIEDIESRIAELFQERLKQKQVILESDVNEAIEILGQPEEYISDEDIDREAEPQNTAYTKRDEQAGSYQRRLYRAPEEGTLGGVCVGLGYYFGIDPVWLRVGFLVALFFAGSGPLLYVILWIALPKANSTAEKLKMRGEPITIENIERKIKEELGRINSKATEFSKETRKRFKNQDVGTRTTNFLNELFEACLRFIGKVVKVMGRSLGVIFLIIGLCLFFVWITSILGSGNLISINNDDGVSFVALHSLFKSIFSISSQLIIFLIGLALVTLAPILGLLMGGMRLLIYPRFRQTWPGAINGGLFIVGLVAIVFSAIILIGDFKSKGKIIESVPVNFNSNDTLNLKINEDANINLKQTASFERWKFYFNDDEEFIQGAIGIKISKAEDGVLKLDAEKSARGASKKESIASAGSINYFVKQDGKSLIFNPYFALRNAGKWRKQSLDFTLAIPEGTYIYLEEGIQGFLYDVSNVHNLDYPEMVNELWRMGKNGLECVSCAEQNNID